MTPRGSFFISATATPEGTLVYDRLEEALEWADARDAEQAEVFIGVNPRAHAGGKTKEAVAQVTTCFADLDLEGAGTDEALLALTESALPCPSLVVQSGFGLHALWVLSTPSPDKGHWRAVQLALLAHLRHFGADPLPAGDEARVLRLVPYPNRKLWPDGIATAIVLETAARYALGDLATVVIREEPVAEPPAARHLVRFIPPPREHGDAGADTAGRRADARGTTPRAGTHRGAHALPGGHGGGGARGAGAVHRHPPHEGHPLWHHPAPRSAQPAQQAHLIQGRSRADHGTVFVASPLLRGSGDAGHVRGLDRRRLCLCLPAL
jgi:hypothetical protein